MRSCDEECSIKGIPDHLHQLGRVVDPDFSDGELLFRRFRFSDVDLTSTIKFNDMSVNRENHGHGPDDALWNDVAGGRYEGYGVLQFPVAALSGTWGHPDGQKFPIDYSLKPSHVPRQCNYPHSEVTAVEFDRKDGTSRFPKDIKPTSVKMRIREHLQPHVRVVLPLERSGQDLPVQRKA